MEKSEGISLLVLGAVFYPFLFIIIVLLASRIVGKMRKYNFSFEISATSKKKKYLETVAVLITIGIVLLFSFSVSSLIDIPILNNIILKSVVTAIVCLGFVIYYFSLLKKRLNLIDVIIFGLLFNALGNWWSDIWFGYIFYVLSIGLFIFYLYNIPYDKEPKETKDVFQSKWKRILLAIVVVSVACIGFVFLIYWLIMNMVVKPNL